MEVQQIVSRLDGLGIGTFPADPWVQNEKHEAAYQKYIGSKVYTAQQQDGRYTKGASEFTVVVNPDNYGVLLRRTLAYSYPIQKTKVYIADVSDDVNAFGTFDQVNFSTADRCAAWNLPVGLSIRVLHPWPETEEQPCGLLGFNLNRRLIIY